MYICAGPLVITTVLFYLQLHSGEHARLALSHLQFVIFITRTLTFIGSLHALDTSETVMWTGYYDADNVFAQTNYSGDGATE